MPGGHPLPETVSSQPGTKRDAREAGAGPALGELIALELPRVRALRRGLHAHPEVGLANPRTQRAILATLDGLGLELILGRGCSSIVATLRTGRPGRTVLLRADTDALPVGEDTSLSFASQVPGVGHMCGHDAHTAMLVGAARLLAGPLRDSLAGTVRFVFQPGEEGHGGAEQMVADGLFDEPTDAAFALHVNPNLRTGMVATKPGPFFACCDVFEVTLTGRGGHGSMPHLCDDPIQGALAVGTALLGTVPRAFGPDSPVVLSLGSVHAGSAPQAIPEAAVLQGTIRALAPADRERAWQRTAALVESIATAHGLTGQLRLLYGCPPTVNSAAHAQHVLTLAAEDLGADHAVRLPAPVMAAEDFGVMLRQVPGALVLIGACPPGLDDVSDAAAVHSSHMVIDEECMVTGMALHVRTALSWTAADPATA
jgi:amidohydrolase